MIFSRHTKSRSTTTERKSDFQSSVSDRAMNIERRNPRSVDIDLLPTERILKIINGEDALVANAVAAAIPQIAKVVDTATECIRAGGRIIYVGTGTSGRLAVVDAAECPPTFGIPSEWIQSVMAGGANAFTH